MAKISLARLDVNALLKLRDDIGGILSRKADELKSQIAKLGGDLMARGRIGRRLSATKGRKVAPKYRDSQTGQTWAGRGARPRWLLARLKAGKKLDDFLIKKARKASKERRKSKRG
jgi:DNA-binding protein H-NS